MTLLTLVCSLALAEENFAGKRYFLGDIHAHSGVSGDGGSSDLDGTCEGNDCGTFEDIFQVARSNGLDFAAVSDHINGSRVTASSDGYEALIALTIAENDPTGGFVTLPAAEVWFGTPTRMLGHKTLLFFGSDDDLANLTLADVRHSGSESSRVDDCAAVWSWADSLQATWGDVLVIPHHPALVAPMPTDWSCTDTAYEAGVEVYSEHGNSLGDGTGYDDPWSGTDVDSTVHFAIDPAGAALQMGFLGGTDKHNSRPGDVCNKDDEHTNHPYGGGLTIAVVPESQTFDRASIHDAIVDRRTLASTGPLLPVDIHYASGGVNLAGLGESFALPTHQDLDVQVDIPPLYVPFVTQVEIVTPSHRYTAIADGAGGFALRVPAAEATGWAYAAVRINGTAWYGASPCDDGGADTDEYVWTSPAYFTEGPEDLDGDGYSYRAGDCKDDDPEIAPGHPDPSGDAIDQDCDGCDGVCAVEAGAALEGDGRRDGGFVPVDGSSPGGAAWAARGTRPDRSLSPLATATIDVVPQSCASAGSHVTWLGAVLGLLSARRRRRP